MCYNPYRMKIKTLENFRAKKGTHADLMLVLMLFPKQILLQSILQLVGASVVHRGWAHKEMQFCSS